MRRLQAAAITYRIAFGPRFKRLHSYCTLESQL